MRLLGPMSVLLALLPAGCATHAAREAPVGERISAEPSTAEPVRAEGVIGKVLIECRDVYDIEESPGIFYRAVNALNVVVRQRVVQREVGLLIHPGAPYDPELFAELERNLRALPFIAQASVEPEFRPDGKVDVHVRTRDRYTLAFGIGFGLFSGSNKLRASVSEQDLFGFGKRMQFLFKTDPDRNTLQARYTDPQFLDARHALDLRWAETSDGHDYALRLEKPFKTLETQWSYGIHLGSSDQKIRFFEGGDEISAIPVEREEGGLFVIRSFGTREDLVRPGLRLTLRRDVYGDPEGEAGGGIEVPEDAWVATVGPSLQRDWLPRYEKRQGLDAIDFVEDVPIGFQLDTFAGVQRRDPLRGDPSLSLAFSSRGTAAFTLGDDHIVTLGGELQFRQGGDPLGWSVSSFLHYYFQGLPNQTWVASVAVDGLWENEDLNTELTLGEDSGLRGYPIREFSGRKRIRLNLEDRLFTDLEILSVHVGGVVFFDSGMAWDRGESMSSGDLARSVGMGIRLGSAPLLGDNVVRIDVGIPLDEVDGERFGLALSASVGQVVRLFKNVEGFESDLGFGF